MATWLSAVQPFTVFQWGGGKGGQCPAGIVCKMMFLELCQPHRLIIIIATETTIIARTHSRYCAKRFVWILSLNPLDNLYEVGSMDLSLSPFCGWGNGGTERSSNCSRSHNQDNQWQSQDLKLALWLQSPKLKDSTPRWDMWLGPRVLFHPHLPRLSPQWLPESARYDVLSGNQEKAIATLKRIATENGAPMPLGKLIISRQVGAWPAVCGVCVSVRLGGSVYVGGACSPRRWQILRQAKSAQAD